MTRYYNQNYTKDEIASILNDIKDCVRKNRYTIAQNKNRQNNIDFINKYNIRSSKQRSLLLNIEPEDFCHSLHNKKLEYEHEILYVFVPQVKLFNIDDDEEIIDLYTKFNLIYMTKGIRTVVISFHKLNKPINYLFR